MLGMEMLLKQFGLDPDELKKNVAAGVEEARNVVAAIFARHDNSDTVLARIEGKLDLLLAHADIDVSAMGRPVGIVIASAAQNGHDAAELNPSEKV